MVLEVLHGPLVSLGRTPRSKCPQISAPSRFCILLPRVETIFSALHLFDHPDLIDSRFWPTLSRVYACGWPSWQNSGATPIHVCARQFVPVWKVLRERPQNVPSSSTLGSSPWTAELMCRDASHSGPCDNPFLLSALCELTFFLRAEGPGSLPRAELSIIRSQLPAWWMRRHVSLHGCGASPRARILQLACWEICLLGRLRERVQ